MDIYWYASIGEVEDDECWCIESRSLTSMGIIEVDNRRVGAKVAALKMCWTLQERSSSVHLSQN